MSDSLDLKAQGPYNSQRSGQQIDASVLIIEALDHLTADQIAAMSSDELDDAAVVWIESGPPRSSCPTSRGTLRTTGSRMRARSSTSS